MPLTPLPRTPRRRRSLPCTAGMPDAAPSSQGLWGALVHALDASQDAVRLSFGGGYVRTAGDCLRATSACLGRPLHLGRDGFSPARFPTPRAPSVQAPRDCVRSPIGDAPPPTRTAAVASITFFRIVCASGNLRARWMVGMVAASVALPPCQELVRDRRCSHPHYPQPTIQGFPLPPCPTPALFVYYVFSLLSPSCCFPSHPPCVVLFGSSWCYEAAPAAPSTAASPPAPAHLQSEQQSERLRRNAPSRTHPRWLPRISFGSAFAHSHHRARTWHGSPDTRHPTPWRPQPQRALYAATPVFPPTPPRFPISQGGAGARG